MEVKNWRCIKTYGQANRYNEVFEIRGERANQYGINITDGSGLILDDFAAVGADDSILNNPRLTTGTKGLDGWTATDDTKVTLTTASGTSAGASYNPPRDPNTTDTVSRISGACTLSQTFNGTRKLLSNPRNIPMWLTAKIYGNAASNTATLTLGNTSVSTVAITNGAWTHIDLTLDSGLWWENFASGQNTLTASLAIAINSGTVDIGHIGLYYMIPIAGQWYIMEAGPTAFALEDSVTVTDALATAEAVTQLYFQRAYGVALIASTDYTYYSGWQDA